MYWAHREGERGQPLIEHLRQTGELAAEFAEAFGACEEGYACGMLHDIGKYSDAFQRRLAGDPRRVDHSTAGAVEAFGRRDVAAAFCIAGHHTGLPDLGNQKVDNADAPTLWGRIKKGREKRIEAYDAYRKEVEAPESSVPEGFAEDKESAFFFTRMLYSCLVDADWLNTESFCTEDGVRRGGYDTLPVLWDRLARRIAPWMADTRELNRRRNRILNTAIERANEDAGLFTMTVPTGGGKTTASMAFALRHCLCSPTCREMRRVIYVIPYCSILEQTQKVFEDIFGAENVVAHASSVEYPMDEDKTDKRALATENWDAPIILTTAVQFFESLYANRPFRCRKLHNIARSVLIFDEAQMLPVPYIRPCLSAIGQLVRRYGCSAVLCTATQPSLGRLLAEYAPNCPVRELCPERDEMYAWFRRVTYQNEGLLSDEALCERLDGEAQVLCVVNSRKQAQRLYAMLEGGDAFHLSTMMTPRDRRAALEEIRRRLREGLPCRVISTSLVEAGVDVDFPTVYRAVAGLDSIIQAAGRCNREGKRAAQDSVAHIFSTEQKPPETLLQNVAAAEWVMRGYDNIAAPEAVNAYFEFLLYRLKGDEELDHWHIMEDIRGGGMPFKSVAESFRIIDSAGCSIIIPQDEGELKAEQLRLYGPSSALLRELAQYSVGVYPGHFRRLIDSGCAQELSPNTAVLTDMELYSKQTGLSFDVEEGRGIFVSG